MFFSFIRKTAIAVSLVVLLGLTLPGVARGADGVPGFDGNAGWLNSTPIQPADLQGKIVLVDFWEYTCVNCLRTLPYMKAWYQRYHDDGLVIVGVHTPEFGFSGDKKNVADATKHLGIPWPVVLDDKDAIWGRYKNDAWPHEYLFDQKGKLIEDVAGEGNYQATEARIQLLIHAQNPQATLPPLMALLPQDSYDKPGAVCYPRTAEMLVAHSAIGNPSRSKSDMNDQQKFEDGAGHKDGTLYLQGTWRLTQEAAVSEGMYGYAAMHYHAVQVVSVLTPEDGKSVRVDVTQDGKPVAKEDAGADLRFDGGGNSYVVVDASRAYDLVMNAKFGEHELQLKPKDYGLGVYSLAFESCEAGK